jgi:hypothetical protein
MYQEPKGADRAGRNRPPRVLHLFDPSHRHEDQTKAYWDPVKEHFKNDDEANGMLSRPQRAPYMIDA